jgi:hypothetical protein
VISNEVATWREAELLERLLQRVTGSFAARGGDGARRAPGPHIFCGAMQDTARTFGQWCLTKEVPCSIDLMDHASSRERVLHALQHPAQGSLRNRLFQEIQWINQRSAATGTLVTVGRDK